MTHEEIRKEFLKFFKSKKHTIVASDSLVPAGDPTVLFTSAGMNQFKEQFLGNIKEFSRAASCQKCLRTDDLVNVGVTSYHHTFFEMLGNFSFGDYFKEEAIKWAWEFMTDILKLPDEKLWVSIYKEDKQAYDIWKDKIKISKGRIVKLGDKENFWPSEAKKRGPNGPCGPCSEIFYDYGPDSGCGRPGCAPGCDCGRFVEVWNLVFTQFNRKEDGVLEPLSNKNIDTGMGLERLCAVMQKVKNNFETDLFKPIIAAIKREITNIINKPVDFDKHKKDIYAIADHVRAVSFAICDGIVPSNEERGYVIRNLIRKSALHGRNLGVEKPFLYKLVSSVANVMQRPYPELKKRRENISQVIKASEGKFISTLKEGTRILEDEIKRLKEEKTFKIPGKFVFKLFDTHGFPFDLTKDLAKVKGFKIDEAGFKQLMAKQREQSRKKSMLASAIFKEPIAREKVKFLGYEKLKTKANVIKIFKDEEEVKQLEGGETGNVILDKSPFYGESGGQLGDTGILSSKKLLARVLDARREADAILLKTKVEKGGLKQADSVVAQVDEERRSAIAKNHTATHLLQSALRKVLGEHVQQQGSLVAPDRLRFDFTHFKTLSQYELDRVEQLVNEKIRGADFIHCDVMDFDKAKEKGALAFFGDKYDKRVRVVSVGDYSMELCGGTHIENTKDIRMFKITSEGSVASGIRRIEAVTDKAAIDVINQQQAALKDIYAILKCKPQDATNKLKTLISDFDRLGKKLRQAALKEARRSVETLVKEARKINGIFFIFSKLEGADPALLRNATDIIREKLKDKDWIAMLNSVYDKQAYLILAMSQDMVKKGFHSGRLISKIASVAGGSGGGKPDMAQGGIKDISGLNNLLDKGKEIILEELKK